ncbi:AraC family transcriptional regulator [Gracilibacillus alcaliphilus]|uniref:AraC family transcriptional regulator n=1 Tax=Gracilibacillus alcaliphilus TaxID=1401441 RepID=UPI0019587760|nr:helix-turn-helix domain-containing protein [Gracilibacillus alcaliphilus]MBM7675600.1 AraC-like DNA-binding protein [Gracilibacillus alcaliphilus]
MPLFFQVSNSSLPIAIASIGNHWNQESIVRPDGYPHFHWLQTEAGIGEIRINGEIIRLPPSKGILIRPFVPHSYYANEGWLTKFVTFNGTLSDHLENIVGKRSYVVSENTTSFSFGDWIDEVVDQHMSGVKNQTKLSTSAYEFLLNLSRKDHLAEHSDHSLYRNYVLPTIEAIENYYDRALTLEGLAEDLFVSPQYLSRVFKKFMGETVISFLQTYRVNKAKELLINHPSLKIQEIAHFCGFSDASYFVSFFRKTTTYTPLQFRKLYLIKKH